MTDTIKIITNAQGPAGQGVPTGGSAGQFLVKIDGDDFNTQWITSSATVSELGDIGNVTLTSISSGEFLSWNGSAWVNVAAPSGGSSTWGSITGTLSAQTDLQTALDTKIESGANISIFTNDSGFITDYTVTQGDVTAHQAALSITESQISDLGSYLTSESNDLTASVTWANVPNANITEGSVTQHQGALSITKSQISDFTETDYATGAEGDLASSAVQPGDNISTLTNDSGFITSAPVTSVASKTGVVTLVKGDVGLGNVDNTSDANKPISTATQTALDGKLANITGESIGDLSDVDTTGLAASKILEYNGANWVVIDTPSGGGGGTTLASMTDVTISSLADNDLFQYNSGSGDWENITQGSLNLSGFNNDLDADDIDDTSTTHKFTTAGDISKLAGIESGATADQTGSEIKSLYEAEADTNAFTDAEKTKLSGIESGAQANVAEVNDLTSAVTWANIPDANVPESAVTQHESALSITESQISDLGNYVSYVASTIQTTDATETTLQTIAIGSGEQKTINIHVKGFESATDDTIWRIIRCGVKNVGGTVSLVGGVASDTGYDAGASSWDVTVTVSGGNVLVRVTGEASHTIDWSSNAEVR